MGRPQSNNAEYFKHYTTMRNHRKVKILRNKFGQVLGYAFWSMMIEFLTEQDGLEWEYSDIEVETFASELGVSATEIREMVDFCIRLELLFMDDHNFICSESLNDDLKAVFVKRNREREKSKVRQRREGKFIVSDRNLKNKTVTTISDGISVAEKPESRVDKSILSNVLSNDNTSVGLSTPTPTSDKKISYDERCKGFIKKFNEVKNNSKYTVTSDVKKKLKPRLEKYQPADIIKVLKAAMKDPHHIKDSLKYLTPSFVLREDIIERYLNQAEIDIPAVYSGIQQTFHNHQDR